MEQSPLFDPSQLFQEIHMASNNETLSVPNTAGCIDTDDIELYLRTVLLELESKPNLSKYEVDLMKQGLNAKLSAPKNNDLNSSGSHKDWLGSSELLQKVVCAFRSVTFQHFVSAAFTLLDEDLHTLSKRVSASNGEIQRLHGYISDINGLTQPQVKGMAQRYIPRIEYLIEMLNSTQVHCKTNLSKSKFILGLEKAFFSLETPVLKSGSIRVKPLTPKGSCIASLLDNLKEFFNDGVSYWDLRSLEKLQAETGIQIEQCGGTNLELQTLQLRIHERVELILTCEMLQFLLKDSFGETYYEYVMQLETTISTLEKQRNHHLLSKMKECLRVSQRMKDEVNVSNTIKLSNDIKSLSEWLNQFSTTDVSRKSLLQMKTNKALLLKMQKLVFHLNCKTEEDKFNVLEMRFWAFVVVSVSSRRRIIEQELSNVERLMFTSPSSVGMLLDDTHSTISDLILLISDSTSVPAWLLSSLEALSTRLSLLEIEAVALNKRTENHRTCKMTFMNLCGRSRD